MTFGIYLLSDLVIGLTRPLHYALRAHIHVILAMVLWETLIFALCALLAAGLKRLPILKGWL